MERVIFGDVFDELCKIDDCSVDLVLIDPPYLNMVNESWDRLSDASAKDLFDFILKESYRILRWGGRFISFSSNDTLKYLYSEKLLHRELLVIDKDYKKVSGGRNTRNYRQHINATEYVFVATKYARPYTRMILLENKGKFSSKDINSYLGVGTNGGGCGAYIQEKINQNKFQQKKIGTSLEK